MARHVPTRPHDQEPELNLTPILNVVLILIPLLLLAVVFNEITVVDVAMPEREGMGDDTGEKPVPPPRVLVGKLGIQILDAHGVVAPDGKCGAMTVCADPTVEGPAGYDWVALYNTLLELKQRPEYAEQPALTIVAEPDISWDVVVTLMDVARFQLAEPGVDATRGARMDSAVELTRARPVVTTDRGTGQRVQLGLFATPTLGPPSW